MQQENIVKRPEDLDIENAYQVLREAGEQLALLYRGGMEADVTEPSQYIAYKDNAELIIPDAVEKINDALEELAPGIDGLNHKPINKRN